MNCAAAHALRLNDSQAKAVALAAVDHEPGGRGRRTPLIQGEDGMGPFRVELAGLASPALAVASKLSTTYVTGDRHLRHSGYRWDVLVPRQLLFARYHETKHIGAPDESSPSKLVRIVTGLPVRCTAAIPSSRTSKCEHEKVNVPWPIKKELSNAQLLVYIGGWYRD